MFSILVYLLRNISNKTSIWIPFRREKSNKVSKITTEKQDPMVEH